MKNLVIKSLAKPKFITAALVAVLTFTLAGLPIAEAKRLGGGSSFGKRSSTVNRQAPAPTAAPAPATREVAPSANPAGAAPAAASNRSRWLGPIAGIAAGLGLAALFSSLGLGGELASLLGSVLMVGLAVLAVIFIWRLLRNQRNANSSAQPAYAGRMMGPNTLGSLGGESKVNPLPSAPVRFEAQPSADFSAASAADADLSKTLPKDFDVESFVRNAKVYFVRLQAAWDTANLNDIREFTTPEMFAEIKVQIDERGAAPNQTDVVTLNAQLLGVETLSSDYLASVHFSGMVREDVGAAAQAFDEVWNLSKPVNGTSGWLLAGIQQVAAGK